MTVRSQPPLAIRQLTLLPSRRPVVLELDAPAARPNGEWSCSYRVGGLGRTRAGSVVGADGLEALLLAVVAVRRELEPFGGRLTWAGEPGELGLPEFVPEFLGGGFRRRIEAMVRAETERETRRLQQCVAPEAVRRPT
ncbi:MAG TPA: hypothetical protein VMY76_14030 [Gemmatimonadales bacterium]|nr:hypothetical protein [Gemmatimonadales bacterium]